MNTTLDTKKDLFQIEQNNLNNRYMVFSKHENLPQCYSFKRKIEALKYANDLNVLAKNEAVKLGFTIV